MGSGDQQAFLARPDVQYVAVCDVRKKWRDESKARVDEKYGSTDCAALVDFREVLGRDDIDAVHIATPDHWHSIMTIAACRAGKDIYLQKPETLTLREGPLMIQAARRYGRVVSGGSQRVLEDYRPLVDPCWAGELGTITSIDLSVGPRSMPCYLPAVATPPKIDWDLWLGPAPWEPYNSGRCDGNFGTGGNSWRSYVDYSGGSLTDWGAHQLWGHDLRRRPAPSAAHDRDLASGIGRRHRGGLHHARVSKRRRDPLQSSRYAPTDRREGGRRPGRPRDHDPGRWYGGRPGAGACLSRHGGIYGDFIECVKTRERPFRDLELGVNTMTAPHLVAISQRLERSLEWDRTAQRFMNDEEANRLLDRARRVRVGR